MTSSSVEDLGRYAFRPWAHEFSTNRGKNMITAPAINAIGKAGPRA
jgi:hypothetical protein